jgi:hypothetical protein
VAVSDDKVKSIAMMKGGEGLVVLVSWIDHPYKTTVTLKAGFANIATPANAETGKPIPIKNGKLTIELPKYGVQLIRFK